MGAEDYCFEDPWESLDRDWQDGSGYFGAEYSITFSKKPNIKRVCTKCTCEFKSRYPSACPTCGGWTEII